MERDREEPGEHRTGFQVENELGLLEGPQWAGVAEAAGKVEGRC